MFVSYDSPLVEVFVRAEGRTWELREASRGESVEIAVLGGELAVEEVYRGVTTERVQP